MSTYRISKANRDAYLKIVESNYNGYANALHKAIRTNKNAVQSRYIKLGGNWDELIRSLKKGLYKQNQNIGELATLATTITTAIPIITAMAKALKGDSSDLLKLTNSDMSLYPETGQLIDTMDTFNTIKSIIPRKRKNTAAPTQKQVMRPVTQSQTVTEDIPAPGKNNSMLFGMAAVALVAVLLLAKK